MTGCIFDDPHLPNTFNLNYMIMESTLNYSFQRQSKNYFEWLLYTIKSEKYHQAESQIVTLQKAG